MNRLFSVIISTFFLLQPACFSQEAVFTSKANVGNVKLPGSMQYDRATGVYTLTGAGVNMWGTSDEFFMVWKQLSGDFTLSAKIAFEGEGVDPHRKMGLIIRQSFEGGSVYADIAVHGDGLTSLQYRRNRYAETEERVSSRKAPNYVLLQRRGNKITVKTDFDKCPDASADADAEVTIDLPPDCYVGLFVCSHNPDVIETARFSMVELIKQGN
jgi:hypothetical protein